MSKDKSSLGTGLDSLLGERPKADSQGVSKIAIEDLSPGQYQPRKKMYKSTLEELAQSIKEQGILQPLVVRRQASGRYEIVVGERRWRAAQLAGLESVPVLVRDLNNDEIAAIEAVANGNAEIAMVDGASGWLGYQVYDLDVVAVEKKPDGRVYYNAAAWVKADSDIAEAYLDNDPETDPFALMEGKKSCHTGWLKSAGMLIPMGYLIGNGYAEVVGDPEEIESLRATVTNFFHEDSEIPEGGTQYSGYKGALKCMMTGHGDIALVKDTAYRLYCDENEDDVPDGPDWCLDRDEIVMLPSFGQAPSHPVMYDPARMDDETMLRIQEALLALDDDSEGREILSDVLNTAGMVASTADEHLGTYSDAVSNVPGIRAYLEK